MFKTRSNCAKCIDVYEKGLRSEPQFKESLKKLTSKEKSFINNRIRDRRKIIHKKFGDIFRDEADTMLSVIENLANKEKMNKMKQQMHLRKGQQLMNKWEKTRLLQKKTRRNEAAKKIQTMFKKTRKYRENKGKLPLFSEKNKKRRFAVGKSYERNMQDLFDTMDVGESPEETAFQEEMASVAKAKNILKAREYNPEAYKRNMREIEQYRKNKSVRTAKRLSQSAREAGIKPYSSPEGSNTSDDSEPKKKTILETIFGASKKKGGRRTRKKRKKRRTRKKRKKRRRRTRK